MTVRHFIITAASLASFFPARAATAPALGIRVNPTAVEVRLGDSKQFTAAGLPPGKSPVWQALPAASGTLSGGGLYTAPAKLPAPNTIVIKVSDSATSPTAAGSATVTLLNPIPAITSLMPVNMNVGLQSKVVITGDGFIPSSQLLIDGKPVVAPAKFVYVSDTEIDYIDTPKAAAALSLTVVNPDPGTRTSSAKPLPVLPPVEVQVSPDKRTVRGGTMLALGVSVRNTADQKVTWSVSGKAGGDKTVGTVTTDAQGRATYNAPEVLPAGNSVIVSASSLADPKAAGQITVALQNPMPIITAVIPKTVDIGSTPVIAITGTGFAKGAVVEINGAAFTTTVVSATSLTATGKIPAVAGRVLPVKVSNPDPGAETSMPWNISETAVKRCGSIANPAECMPFGDAVRFLEMATWGPTPASIAHLQEIGRDRWLTEQLALPGTAWPLATDLNEGANRIRQEFFTRALTGDDQLRQRVAFALSQIFVVSGTKDNRYEAMRSYSTALSDNAFGTYRNLLGVMTLNPAMGWFLDMVNNDKANPSRNTVANENYAREVMQLFSLGLVVLGPDGTAGATPAYDQQTVTELAKVFTGWTYPNIPGTVGHWRNDPYFEGPMEAFADHHDTTPKTIDLAGQAACSLSGDQRNDLTGALDCIANHPNVAPFISYRLIQRLVKSAPSPAYVGDIALVFHNTRGNLGEVAKAILTHKEATTEGGSGKLREPVLYATSLLRALDATISAGGASGLADQSKLMGQDVLYSPSVFNYFSPFYRVPGFGAVAPEFQGFNASTGLSRLNFAYRAINNRLSNNIHVDLTKWQDLQADSAVLIGAIDEALYHGRMDSALKAKLTAAATGASPSNRARNMLYLAAAAPEYQVEQ